MTLFWVNDRHHFFKKCLFTKNGAQKSHPRRQKRGRRTKSATYTSTEQHGAPPTEVLIRRNPLIPWPLHSTAGQRPPRGIKTNKKEQEPSVKRRRILRKKVLKKEYVLDERQDDFKKKSPTYGRRIMSDGGRCWYGVDTVFGRCWYGVGVDYQRVRGVFIQQTSHSQRVMWGF